METTKETTKKGGSTSAYNYTPKGTARKTEKGNIIVTLEDGTQLMIREVKSEKVLFHYKKLTDKVYDTMVVDQMVLERPELLPQHASEVKTTKTEEKPKVVPKVVHSLQDYATIYKDYIGNHPDLRGIQLLVQHRKDVEAAIAENPEMDYKQTLANINTATKLAKKVLDAKLAKAKASKAVSVTEADLPKTMKGGE